jgi:hypothetical protein
MEVKGVQTKLLQFWKTELALLFGFFFGSDEREDFASEPWNP